MSHLTFAMLLPVCLFWFVGRLLRCHPWGSISIKATRQKPDTHHKAFSNTAKAVLGVHRSLCEAGSCELYQRHLRALCNIYSYIWCMWAYRHEGTNNCMVSVYCLFFSKEKRNTKAGILLVWSWHTKGFRNSLKFPQILWLELSKHTQCIECNVFSNPN